jgi:hypothetical protein
VIQPALNRRTRVECAHVTLQVVRLGGGTKSGLSTWFERVQILGYQSLPARLHPFPLIHIFSSYGDCTGESLPYSSQRFLTPPLRQHYLWAGGHFILLISALRYFLAIVTLKAISSWWYKGTVLSRHDFQRAAADNTDRANS